MIGELTLALEAEPPDCLGIVFHDLELHNRSPKGLIAKRGYVRASEPACGAGATIIALAQAMRNEGINFQKHLHVTAVDIDPKCVHMAYVQFVLLADRQSGPP